MGISVVYKSREKNTRCGILRNVQAVKETQKMIKFTSCNGLVERTLRKEDVIFSGDHDKAEKTYKEF